MGWRNYGDEGHAGYGGGIIITGCGGGGGATLAHEGRGLSKAPAPAHVRAYSHVSSSRCAFRYLSENTPSL